MTEEDTPRVSVVITTRNRRDLLVRAVESCLVQSQPCEVIVFDDASSDGTSEAIKKKFPEVDLIRRGSSHDSCINRNEGFQRARGEYVVSLDDDSHFVDSATLECVVRMFDSNPMAGALALAFVEPNTRRGKKAKSTPLPGTRMRGYVACAAAFRRDIVRRVGGYSELLVHQGEERDLAIRMIDKGYDIIFADCPPIVHLPSGKRNHARMGYYSFRNTILFSWMRVPAPDFVLRAIIDSMQLIKYKFTIDSLPSRVKALRDGWIGMLKYWHARAPVSRATYRKYRRMPSHGPVPVDLLR